MTQMKAALRSWIRERLPVALIEQYRAIRLARERKANARRGTQAVFEEIYADNRWGGVPGEFCSGSGSDVAFTEKYAQLVRAFVHEHAIARIVDVGCGDFRVGRQIVSPSVRYTGVDVVKPLIEYNQRTYGGPGVSFVHCNAVTDALPDGELCLIRQVLQHLSNDQVQAIVHKALKQYRYVLVTEHLPAPGPWVRPNRDKPHGPDTRIADDSGLFLDQPPFSFPVEAVLLRMDVVQPLRRSGEQIVTFLLRARG